jgi:hypothetical protein
MLWADETCVLDYIFLSLGDHFKHLSTLPLLAFRRERKENRERVRFEVLTAMPVTSCSMVVRHQHFGGKLYLHPHECCITNYKSQTHIGEVVWYMDRYNVRWTVGLLTTVFTCQLVDMTDGSPVWHSTDPYTKLLPWYRSVTTAANPGKFFQVEQGVASELIKPILPSELMGLWTFPSVRYARNFGSIELSLVHCSLCRTTYI